MESTPRLQKRLRHRWSVYDICGQSKSVIDFYGIDGTSSEFCGGGFEEEGFVEEITLQE